MKSGSRQTGSGSSAASTGTSYAANSAGAQQAIQDAIATTADELGYNPLDQSGITQAAIRERNNQVAFEQGYVDMSNRQLYALESEIGYNYGILRDRVDDNQNALRISVLMGNSDTAQLQRVLARNYTQMRQLTDRRNAITQTLFDRESPF